MNSVYILPLSGHDHNNWYCTNFVVNCLKSQALMDLATLTTISGFLCQLSTTIFYSVCVIPARCSYFNCWILKSSIICWILKYIYPYCCSQITPSTRKGSGDNLQISRWHGGMWMCQSDHSIIPAVTWLEHTRAEPSASCVPWVHAIVDKTLLGVITNGNSQNSAYDQLSAAIYYNVHAYFQQENGRLCVQNVWLSM